MKAQHNSPKQIYAFKLTVWLFHLYTAIAAIYKLRLPTLRDQSCQKECGVPSKQSVSLLS